MTNFLEKNRYYWNELVAIHSASSYYDIEGFRQGKSSLLAVEKEELGDIAGKSLLHLQCHIGLDTLSLVRDKKVKAVGVDFSDTAINFSQRLADELKIPASFICSEISSLPKMLDEKFDIIFSSYGVLMWLNDIEEWARIINNFLKIGGFFYLVDEHPFASVFSGDKNNNYLKLYAPYRSSKYPYVTDNKYSYIGEGKSLKQQVQYKWGHSFSEIINVFINEGLKLEFIHEFHKSFYNMLPGMEKKADGWWYLKENSESLPLMFSFKVTK